MAEKLMAWRQTHASGMILKHCCDSLQRDAPHAV
jgi:hypothetical protein